MRPALPDVYKRQTGSYAQANIGMALGIVIGIAIYWKRLTNKLQVINEGFSRCSVILPVLSLIHI